MPYAIGGLWEDESPLIESMNYNFENETPEDSYNEGLKWATAMKSSNKSDRKLVIAKSIRRFIS